jgi:hypothetical protein
MANFYTPARTAALVALVGAPRFGPYLAAANGDVRAALDLYVWNLCLSASFHGPLSILEVTVRNALHRELSVLFGPSWHTDPGFQAAAPGSRRRCTRRALARGSNGQYRSPLATRQRAR